MGSFGVLFHRWLKETHGRGYRSPSSPDAVGSAAAAAGTEATSLGRSRAEFGKKLGLQQYHWAAQVSPLETSTLGDFSCKIHFQLVVLSLVFGNRLR